MLKNLHSTLRQKKKEEKLRNYDDAFGLPNTCMCVDNEMLMLAGGKSVNYNNKKYLLNLNHNRKQIKHLPFKSWVVVFTTNIYSYL